MKKMKHIKLFEAFNSNSNIMVVLEFDKANKVVQDVIMKNATIVDLPSCELEDLIGVKTSNQGLLKPHYMSDKKVVMINFERATPDVKDYIENNLDVKWVHADDLDPEDVQGLSYPSEYETGF